MKTEIYQEMEIADEVVKLAGEVEQEIEPILKQIDEVAEFNSAKVLKAFQDNMIADMHFNSTTGYGYGDIGRRWWNNQHQRLQNSGRFGRRIDFYGDRKW